MTSNDTGDVVSLECHLQYPAVSLATQLSCEKTWINIISMWNGSLTNRWTCEKDLIEQGFSKSDARIVHLNWHYYLHSLVLSKKHIEYSISFCSLLNSKAVVSKSRQLLIVERFYFCRGFATVKYVMFARKIKQVDTESNLTQNEGRSVVSSKEMIKICALCTSLLLRCTGATGRLNVAL